ncbi:MAG: hypothetical protein COX51_07455 [Syntrophobacteraceae bacterium CG23_combo_of_CG06-09_8_20_14_all_50_8]|nr:MAG: hypothetical protein COX51_07455 [Syntrophobacteraceae bacterium CG23_combo_of_CG06-09_8_20_14_all_50_8]
MTAFTPNHHFRREYERLFKKDPLGANVFLLLAELADEKGQVQTSEKELADLIAARFDDPRAYQLPGGRP